MFNMLDNHTYNLAHQLVQESKTLKRINENYRNDAGDCVMCKEFWDKLEQDKKQHVRDLTELLKTHLK